MQVLEFIPAAHSPSVQERIKLLFDEAQHGHYKRTDRMFVILMLVQWLFGIVLALTLSPKTWAGADSSTHIHVYAALFLGGLITLFPVTLAWVRPGQTLTRHVIAGSQLLMSGLLIHLSGGRIETHFHIFGSLAFLAFYRDWRILITATVVVAGDHFVRGMWFTESVFGVETAAVWRVIEHAGWVIFEDAVLVVACLQGVKERYNTASQHVALETAKENLNNEKASVERKVVEATKASELQKTYLSNNVRRMLSEIDKFAKGDLTVRLVKEKDDEIGQLYDGFNQAMSNINDLFRQVADAVEATALAAAQISRSSEGVAEGTREQSVQSGAVAFAIEEMTEIIYQNEQNAKMTAQAATGNGEIAGQGKEVAQQGVNKMRRIAEVVKSSAATVEHLGNSTAQISEIVAVIDAIADQTNLLALNAAIEAARAGEKGRGFAVVADEVRKLAVRTNAATQEISAMIKAIQGETQKAVKVMRTGTTEVEEGIALSDRTGEALNKVVTEAQNMLQMVAQIVSAGEQQSISSRQISQNVQMISSVSSQSAHAVGQIARAANDLSDLTGNLRQLISKFKADRDPAVEFALEDKDVHFDLLDKVY